MGLVPARPGPLWPTDWVPTRGAGRMAGFGVRGSPPADLSAVDAPRRVAASKSGDESPHSKPPLRIDLVRSWARLTPMGQGPGFRDEP